MPRANALTSVVFFTSSAMLVMSYKLLFRLSLNCSQFGFVRFRGCSCFFAGHSSAVSREFTSKRKTAEFIAHHVFCNEHIYKNLAIVNRKGKAHHFRSDRRVARPGFNRGFHARLEVRHLFEKPWVNIWTFFQ